MENDLAPAYNQAILDEKSKESTHTRVCIGGIWDSSKPSHFPRRCRYHHASTIGSSYDIFINVTTDEEHLQNIEEVCARLS